MTDDNEKIKYMKGEYMKTEIPAELDKKMREATIRGMSAIRRKNLFLKRTAAACTAAACFSLFALAVNVNPVMAESLQDIPILGNLARLVTVEKIDIHDGKLEANAEIPSVEGLKDKDYQNALNKEIEDKIQGTIGSALEESKTREEGQMPVMVDSNYILKSSTPEILSFGLVTTRVQASGYEEYTYYNIDLKNNLALSLGDLFKPGSDYVEVINKYISEQIAAQIESGEGEYFTSADDTPEDSSFKSIAADQSFFINEDGKLVITFGEYEIAPGSSGSPEFIIPTDILIECLNDSGYIK